MRLRSIPMVLVGDRGAILDVARSRWSLAVGLLLVLSASLARNYDGADLLHEWEVLTHGLGASIGNAFILFGLVYMAAVVRTPEAEKGSLPRFVPAYLSFLAVFWMTAPMGWLYGIPYERMFDRPVEAVEANLWTLAAVSVWRVVLITRVLAVLWGARFWSLVFVVLLFSDVAVVLAAAMMPKPLIDFMGGLQHTEEDALISGITFSLQFWGVLLSPVLLIGALVGLRRFVPRWAVGSGRAEGDASAGELEEHAGGRKAAWGALALACAAVFFWLVPMTVTQPEQRNRRAAELMLRAGDVGAAFEFMSARQRGDFPPVWDPPPRLGYGEDVPEMEEVAVALRDGEVAEWVWGLYLPKVERYARRLRHYGGNWSFQQLVQMFPASSDRDEHERDMVQSLRARRVAFELLLERESSLPEEERAAIRRLLELMEEEPAGEDEGGA